jgi:hypothetical protein
MTVLALVIVACGSPVPVNPVGSPFQLLTGGAPSIAGRCFGHEISEFVLHPTYGVAVRQGGSDIPAAFPGGFVARWVGDQIQVFQDGKVVVETGKIYSFWSSGLVDPADWVGTPLPEGGAYLVCHGFEPAPNG